MVGLSNLDYNTIRLESNSDKEIIQSNPTILHKILQKLPFSWLGIVKKQINMNCKTILDVGCGYGFPMQTINTKKRFETVGIDIFMPYIRICKEKKIHNNYILCDVKYLPFKDKTFDTIICLEVIEHLPKSEGFNLIRDIENIARNQVILSTPVGICHQNEGDNNEYMEHKSSWELIEFNKMNYKTIGWGLKYLFGNRTPPTGISWMLVVSTVAIYILGIIPYFFTHLASHMVCSKNIKK